MKDMRECKHFNICEANLYPYDFDKGLECRVWWTDWDVCKLSEAPKWVITQKKIKKLKLGREIGFFTILDLMKLKIVKPDIKGRNERHPQKQDISISDRILRGSTHSME